MSLAVREFLASLRARGIVVRRKPAGDRLGRLKCIARLNFSPASRLTDTDHAFIRAHLPELLAAVPDQTAPRRGPKPAPDRPASKSGQRGLAENGDRSAPQVETQARPSPRPRASERAAGSPSPTPEAPRVISVRGHGRIDEAMVLEMLRDLGDEADYQSGRLSKTKAYAMAGAWVKARLDLGLVRVGSRWVEASELPLEFFLRGRES